MLIAKMIYSTLPDGRLKTTVIARSDCPYCGQKLTADKDYRECVRCGFRVKQITVFT